MERNAWKRQLRLAASSIRLIDASSQPARGATWNDVLRQLDELDDALAAQDEQAVTHAVRRLEDLVFVPSRGTDVPQPTEPPPALVLERIPKLVHKIGRMVELAHG